MKSILLENAYEAWIAAVKCCNDILNGKATLQYQKSFVSSLQNAIELFLKQIMLDTGNHNIAEISKIKDADDAQLVLDYMKAQDLNAFFNDLSADKLHKFKTIDFSNLIEQHRKLLSKSLSQGESLKEELKTLQNLRNNETHFAIHQNDFLSEHDFCSLHNLMVRFYKILEDYDLLGFWGEPGDEYLTRVFDRDMLLAFSYADAVRNSPLVKELVSILPDWWLCGAPDFSPYCLACGIVQEYPEYKTQFHDVWTMVEMMQSVGMIKIEEIVEDDESADCIPRVHYIMEII